MTTERQLVGRDGECSAIDHLLADAARLRSGSLLLEGEAGAGKTALLDYAAASAGGLRVLRAEGVEPESDLPFAGLHQLLRPVLDRLDVLPDVQSAALRGALAMGPVGTGPQPAERLLVGVGVLSLLAEAAADHGLLCLVDDVQWLDRESADALLFVARRLEAEAVGMLFAVRSEGSPWEAPMLPRIRLEGLRQAEAAVLLHRTGADLAPGVLDRVIELTDGNPLALLELPGSLSAAQRSGAEPLPAHLPVGERIRRAYLARVSTLPEASQLLLLMAAAEPNGDLGLLARAARQLAVGVTALDAAERAGMVTVDHGAVRFRHPLLRSAIYTAAPYAQRHAVHTALADALIDAEPDRWAWHRAAVANQPDPKLADELERSADRARARGGHAAAAAALERAAELTPDDSHRARRLVAAASAVWEAGQADRAERLLARAETLQPPARVRAEINYLRGAIELHTRRPARAVPMLRSAADLVAADDPGRSLRMLLSAMTAMGVSGDFSRVGELAQLAARLPADHPDAVMADLIVGLQRLLSGDRAGATVSLRSFMDYAKRFRDPLELGLGGLAALLQDDDAAAAEFHERAVAVARQTGALGALPWALESCALIEVRSGQLSRAEADATESLRLTELLGHGRGWMGALAVLAAVASYRGHEEQCRVFAEQAIAAAEQHGLFIPWILAVASMAELDLCLGRTEQALDRQQQLADAWTSQPIVRILATPVRIEAQVRSGRPVDPAEAALFEAWARYSPSRAIAALAARCRAMLADGDEAATHYEEALTLHKAAGRPLDRARTQLLYGEFLRRQRRRTKARSQLRAAMETFDRLGAPVWAERARTELRAIGETVGGRPADAFELLTPQELQIVRLVSGGMSNRQVAAQLFLSPRTVEYHLAKVYPKVNISSRGELIRSYLVAAGVATGSSTDSGRAVASTP
ncbi:MAG TPA: AAA family ATPase [Pseudonocardiaceae bacterium]|jgi:DNA-binding CsgD family transcriptional regulator